jgi:hypothetical protein
MYQTNGTKRQYLQSYYNKHQNNFDTNNPELYPKSLLNSKINAYQYRQGITKELQIYSFKTQHYKNNSNKHETTNQTD